MGSAYKNKAVQPLLDAGDLLPPQPHRGGERGSSISARTRRRSSSPTTRRPPGGLAFKLEEGRFGQLTYIRIYQGKLTKGDTIVNARTGRDSRVGRLVRMHSDEMEDINGATAGRHRRPLRDRLRLGDTFTSDKIRVAMTSMHVPAPVIHLTIKPKDKKAQANVAKALGRFTKEDPTFHARVDDESGETIISGMGELHLDVYVERMKREYNAEVETGAPQVAYREAITRHAEFNYVHKKQTGGSGQYGKVGGYVEPWSEGDFEFVNEVYGGSIPSEFIPRWRRASAP
jgi:elongation factor G